MKQNFIATVSSISFQAVFVPRKKLSRLRATKELNCKAKVQLSYTLLNQDLKYICLAN